MSAKELYRERELARRARVAERAQARRDSEREYYLTNEQFKILLEEQGKSNERV